MNPGELIRQTRERHGLSQSRLARRAGTTQAVVSRIERGEALPSFDMVRRLLAAMGWELGLELRRSRWQDHDPAALQAFGRQDPQQRLDGVARAAGVASELRGAALDDLVAMKLALGRPKDLQDVADVTAHEAGEYLPPPTS